MYFTPTLLSCYLAFGAVLGGFHMGLRAGREELLPKSVRTSPAASFAAACVILFLWPLVCLYWLLKARRP